MIENQPLQYHKGIYTPLIKHKGFNPNPVAGNIPMWADGKNNPKCIGTNGHTDFWLEQIDRCLNGYDTGGVHIPGRHYFYMNFVTLTGLMGLQYPFYVDFDKEYAETVDYVKRERKKGGIFLKARRKGVSEKNDGMIIQYGLRFIPGYRALVGAGLETYTKGLKQKIDKASAAFCDEMKLNEVLNNSKIIEAGFEVRSITGDFNIEGYHGIVDFETFYQKAEKKEGEYYHDASLEEAGEFENLDEVTDSIGPNMEFGSIVLGSMWIYGTAGKILKGSKAFYNMYNKAEELGYVKMFIPGSRMHFPFYVNKLVVEERDPITNQPIDTIPNIKKISLDQERTLGCEDVKAAEEHILLLRKHYAKLKDKKKLREHMQNYPLTEQEAWASSGNNNFDSDLLYDALYQIEAQEREWTKWVLEWVMDDQNKIAHPLMVKARPAKDSDQDWNCVLIYKHPRNDYKNLDYGGLDSYNQDSSKTSKSQGGIAIGRMGRYLPSSDIDYRPGTYPIAIYSQRPPRKEIFFEMGVKMAVYWRLKKNMLVSADQDLVIDWFKSMGAVSYLSPRPKKFDAPNSTVVNPYGIKPTPYNKPLMIGLIQSWILDCVTYCVFEFMLREMLAFDEEHQGTDWDIVDAWGYLLMRIEDVKFKPQSEDADLYKEPETIWVKNESGNMVPVLKNYKPVDRDLSERSNTWSRL